MNFYLGNVTVPVSEDEDDVASDWVCQMLSDLGFGADDISDSDQTLLMLGFIHAMRTFNVQIVGREG